MNERDEIYLCSIATDIAVQNGCLIQPQRVETTFPVFVFSLNSQKLKAVDHSIMFVLQNNMYHL